MSDKSNANQKKTYSQYQGSAGGWGALASTAKHLLRSDNVAKNIKNLLKTNQTHGFDCPGCAWGEKDEPGRFRFCENGAKAVNWEATGRRVGEQFFTQHTVSWLAKQSDFFLEDQGRLAQPLSYDSALDKYLAISWDEAFALVAEHLTQLESSNQAEFYTSGRTSNEAAFLYQLFVRAYGTNNFPDCSNMCHEASGVALKQAIGVGKGTVTLTDFEHADAIFIFGQNPGTNHPRMLDTLSQASRRGATIVSFNPLKERGLERFTNPQSTTEMLTGGATQISSHYFQPNLGGDMAAVRGIVKVLAERHQQALAKGASVFDLDFIAAHTEGMADYLAAVDATDWQHIEQQSGLSRSQLAQAATLYQNADNVIFTWAMGITQHKHSVATIQEMTNLQLLFGQIGKRGAGLCPVRGHSNVQGDRTMGINEKPDPAFLNKLAAVFDFEPPRAHGHNTVQAIEAMLSGHSRVFVGLGGNFVAATPDTELSKQAMANCQLTVHIATKLNRTHVTPGKQSLILPCLGRTDIDQQASGPQQVTVEDSFSMVHASAGVVASEIGEMRSEPAIVAGIAQATLGNLPVNWQELITDYRNIRELISQVIPGFHNMNQRLTAPGGFYLGNSAAERLWQTSQQKAQILSHSLPEAIVPASVRALSSDRVFTLQTLRSHDQYNTTVYGFEDRYRGISGDRKVLLINSDDIKALGMQAEQLVDIESLWPDEITRKVTGFRLIPYDMPAGNTAAYFPEANALVPLASVGQQSFTPTSKSIAIVITPHQPILEETRIL
ncbi:FdhF/YdeP family oxidoreductase [Thalassotalea euphylliae]|uniref:CbbBc protein n=1 Tax=Thalassotalea euphylliae TaxID=1655234 RepID=A0A3E0UKC4_9GAMM|nr:FdhF/YdeP family oxidoreductase [Thalassotalea euphylliae]REL37083.1 CbbBc protein [Thalassotalea euphylliae]